MSNPSALRRPSSPPSPCRRASVERRRRINSGGGDSTALGSHRHEEVIDSRHRSVHVTRGHRDRRVERASLNREDLWLIRVSLKPDADPDPDPIDLIRPVLLLSYGILDN